MLATSVRVSPCSALCRFSSDGRRTTTAFSSSARVSSGGNVREISPFGPFTVTVRPATCAVTPWGSGTGFLPMRDMPLPDHREQLAAHAGGTGFAVRHQALGRREDGHPEPVLHARDLARFDVAPQPRGGDALQLADHRGVVVVLQVQPQQTMTAIVQDFEVLDVMVVAEQDPK